MNLRDMLLNENSCFWKNNVYDICFTKLKSKQNLNILFKYTKLVKIVSKNNGMTVASREYFSLEGKAKGIR